MSLISEIINHKDVVHNHNNQGTATFKGFNLTLAKAGASQALVAVDLNKTVQLYMVEAQNHCAFNIKHQNGAEHLYQYDFNRTAWLDRNNRPISPEAIRSQLELAGCKVFTKFIK